jgi:hypothetical protein
MEALKLLILVSMGIIAGWLGFQAYPSAEVAGAITVIITASWLLYRFSGGELAWYTLSWLTLPNMMFIVGLLAGASYFMIDGGMFGESWLFGLGVAFLAAAAGITFYNYWTIGD